MSLNHVILKMSQKPSNTGTKWCCAFSCLQAGCSSRKSRLVQFKNMFFCQSRVFKILLVVWKIFPVPVRIISPHGSRLVIVIWNNITWGDGGEYICHDIQKWTQTNQTRTGLKSTLQVNK